MKFCNFCGKELSDNSVYCDSCGRQQESGKPKQTFNKFMDDLGDNFNHAANDISSQPILAIASLCCGVASFFVGGIFLGIAAVVLAVISKNDTDGVYSTPAKIGLACGIISSVLSIFVVVLLVLSALGMIATLGFWL